ncbi:AbrB/MazE/SpoVT family DNA-binding domain-containing protein [candidate division CSSED10-310 bacterium]|uniref:AbrB/MazE/SpoVT family DNA-binding domain-containing protein n=1 Tax=candidate division CSSED10-310 bacterium TaxID=2855610 RepID=A0ABV6Z1G3_UNCC1
MLTKKTSKNQVTLPKDIIKNFPEVEYFKVTMEENKIVLTPVKITPIPTPLTEIRKKMERLNIRSADVKEAIQWSRQKNQSE